MPDALGLERPRHRDLVDADADLGGVGLGDAEVVERLAHVEVALAAGDDAEPRLRRVDDDPVEPVDAAVVQRRVDLVVLHPRFGLEEAVGPADRQAVRRQREIVGHDDLRARRIDVHRRRALDGVGDALEADPAARVPRHRPAVQAEIEDLLHARRIEHRHQRRREHVIRLVRQRRRLRAVIVARERQHAAVLRGSRVVGVLEHVAAAVDARTLAVPHREHAVVFRARVQVHLLRAPDRGRREVLVQSGLELDVRALEELLRLPQRLVERAERRAAIARNEAGGVEAGEHVALALQDQQPHERLGAGQVDAPGLEGVLVVQRDVAQDGCGRSHGRILRKIVSWGCAESRIGSATHAAGIVSLPRSVWFGRGVYADVHLTAIRIRGLTCDPTLREQGLCRASAKADGAGRMRSPSSPDDHARPP